MPETRRYVKFAFFSC